MAGSYLLDTNIVIALFASEPSAVDQFANANEVFLCGVVVGELYFGARKSARVTENVARVDALAATNPILDCDLDTSRQYGIVKESLRAKGKLIPDNDIWIAAIALQFGLILATRDAHFNEVDGLPIATW